MEGRHKIKKEEKDKKKQGSEFKDTTDKRIRDKIKQLLGRSTDQ